MEARIIRGGSFSAADDEQGRTPPKTEKRSRDTLTLTSSAAPLCICPTCEKVLQSLRSLFGHCGRAHKTPIEQEKIKFMCPFDEDPVEVFDSITQLEQWCSKYYPGCTLITSLSFSENLNQDKPKKSSKSKPKPSTGLPSSTSPTEIKRTTRLKTDPKASSKQILCKCPSCDKILPPTGLVGHFGRVHSGQLGTGSVEKFSWKKVAFACPFCPEDTYATPRTFRTVEQAEAHVSNRHPNCLLIINSNLSGVRIPKSSPPVVFQPDGTMRKSQRQPQRSSMLDEYTDNEPVSTKSQQGCGPAIKRGAVDGDLFKCPFPGCEKTNLSRHGLHAHYGMMHGGSVDFSKVTIILPATKKSTKQEAVISKTGPWSDEEHEAFIEGYKKYGNKWTKISTDYVPTRDAKQIGSHALNYFTTRGEWHGAARGSVGSARSAGDRQSARASNRMLEDGDEKGEEELDAEFKRESDDEEEDESEASDDGNSSHCICCFEGGNIVCCSKCPRAFHPKCLAKDKLKGGGINVEELPHDWQCHRCGKDSEVMPGEEIPQYAYGHKKIRAAYAEFKDCSDYNYCCTLLSNVLDILKKLMSYDYGYVFAEPVNIESVPDYLDIVENPMDFGTVLERLEGGNYVDLITSDDVHQDDENSTMEEVLLQVLCDIERVTFNCQVYNKKGSSIYRIGDVIAKKWSAYFYEYIDEKLPENVGRDLTQFRQNCKLKLDGDSPSKRRIKNEKESNVRKPSPPVPEKTLTTQARKRKASDEYNVEEENVEEEHEEEDEDDGHEEDEEEEEEEEERPKLPKKRKQEECHTGQSSALIFTEDQMRSLENVFFSSAGELLMNELPAFSAPSLDLNRNKHEDESSPSLNASLRSPPGDHDGMLLIVKSEDYKVDESAPDGLAVASLPTNSNNSNALTVNAEISSDSAINQYDIPESNGKNAVNTSFSSDGNQYTIFQQQWYERLDELKRYKITHGTALGSALSTEKLYHWRLRQRKRYHLTLHRFPHLKRVTADEDSGGNQNDKQWLLSLPEMKGVFSYSAMNEISDEDKEPFVFDEKDVKLDELAVDFICNKHQEQLYCPLQTMYTPFGAQVFVPNSFSSRHSNSLFWDECLEELRFFQGDHQHTFVPRKFPYSFYLSIWVEIQRAKYLLQSMGLFSGLSGAQMLVLDELNLCNLCSLPTNEALLKAESRAVSDSALVKSNSRKMFVEKENGKGKTKEGQRKLWSTNFDLFKAWYQSLSSEDRAKAWELLPRQNWPLYTWCWRQCNAASAILCGSPSVLGVRMSVKKLGTLSSSGFFHAFPYNDKHSRLVCEDDYEGCEAFDSTLELLEEISIKYGSSHIPDWYACDQALRMWVMALETSVASLVKGGPCVLSVKQIEKLILIGFCRDREGLPNLSRGDLIWLKMLQEFKSHVELFGASYITDDFPHLYAWIAEQKQLFLQSRKMVGKDPTNALKASRLFQLKEAGVDFFTGECLPGEIGETQEFDRLTAAPVESFPLHERRANVVTFAFDNYWNGRQCLEKFEKFKALHGHSLLLASDDEDLYVWFMEKRGKALLSEIDNLNKDKGSNVLLYSHSVIQYISTTSSNDGSKTTSSNDGSKAEKVEVDRSMFLWLHYYERLLIFKARMGHCKLPNEYPDMPLKRWVLQQQDLMHTYSVNRSIELKPVQVKLLHALGVHGHKRQDVSPTLNSRVMKNKVPSRKKVKQLYAKKTKSD